VTHFIAGGSTGGTVSGVGRYLKEKNPEIKVHMADPKGSIFRTFFKTGKLVPAEKFLVEGVGKNNIPKAMHFSVIDDIIEVTDKESFLMC
jgi:cystathionine beta-synthase